MQIKKLIFALTLAFGGLTANCFAQAPITIGAYDGPVTIIGVEVAAFHGNQAHISPGATFGMHFLYTIVDVGCPGCVDQIQIGFANSTPTTCAYNGTPGPVGVSNDARVMLTAPTTPGTYYIAFDRSQQFFCPTGAWWNGTPQPNQYIAAINVF